MSHLKNYVHQMTNPELIGLAKNRFLDSEDQVAIAKFHYRRAHNYLIENTKLSHPARDILWNYKGYARKCDLLTYGHYVAEPEKYHELYDNFASQMRIRSPWRIPRVFLHHSRWHSHGQSVHTKETGCPAPIIEDIYLNDVQRARANKSSYRANWYYATRPEYAEKQIIENRNTPLELLVKISASSPDANNRTAAMRTMARRS